MGQPRFTDKDVETWRRDGIALIRDFFTPGEIAAVRADFATVFERSAGADQAMVKKKEGEIGRFHDAQFKTLEAAPFDCSPALNLIGVHPALIAFAKQALRTNAVHLYQCQAWAKFTGDADYDQPSCKYRCGSLQEFRDFLQIVCRGRYPLARRKAL